MKTEVKIDISEKCDPGKAVGGKFRSVMSTLRKNVEPKLVGWLTVQEARKRRATKQTNKQNNPPKTNKKKPQPTNRTLTHTQTYKHTQKQTNKSTLNWSW